MLPFQQDENIEYLQHNPLHAYSEVSPTALNRPYTGVSGYRIVTLISFKMFKPTVDISLFTFRLDNIRYNKQSCQNL